MNKNIFLLSTLVFTLLMNQALAENKAALQHKSASLQCLDRKIELQADCFQEDGVPGLSCTRQSLRFSNAADNKILSSRIFKTAPKDADQDYPVVPDKINDLVCVATPQDEKYIVTKIDNGGNCDQCEWAEVYSWDGILIGSDRDKKKKNIVVKAAVAAAFGAKTKKIIDKKDLTNFYQGAGHNGD